MLRSLFLQCFCSSRPVRACCLVGMLSVTSHSFAQEANIWYFGYQAGIDFNSGTPAALLDGEMISFEGCASICDDNGDLLFYTNGGPTPVPPYDFGAVWDADHEVMPNGDLVSAGGCSSASQGALIVQDPGNDDHYYIFTTDCIKNQFAGGLRYSKVNMTLNSGLGDVTDAGTPLLTGVREALLGIRHANGTDVWVLVQGGINNNTYYSFLVTASGISGPDSTAIGPVINGSGGQMSTNLLGTKVHHAAVTNSSLFDFDPATGVLSNYTDLQSTSLVNGCAFAAGGRYLYVGELQWLGDIFQYDLLATDIPASEQSIAQVMAIHSGMQLAPDGKIYISQVDRDYLGVINNPDSAGVSANHQMEGFYLGGRESRGSLPNFVNDLLNPTVVGIAEGPTGPIVQCTVSGDELWIRSGANMGQGRFSILRSDGALALEGGLTGGNATVAIAQFASGLYMVRVTDSDDSFGTAKLLIAR